MRRIIIISICALTILFTSLNIQSIDTEEITTINVEIRGAVKQEKSIQIPLGSKFEDILTYVELNEDADISMYSFNDVLFNNQVIEIPIKSDIKLISINTATIQELCSLPGIGEKMAQRIIDYRQNNGSFRELQDLKNINGIGDKKYEKIKEFITL